MFGLTLPPATRCRIWLLWVSVLLGTASPLARGLDVDETARLEVVAGFKMPPMTPRRAAPLEVGGRIYFTASKGGDWGSGALLRTHSSGVETLLHFTGENGLAPGRSPGGLLVEAGGLIWGTTEAGGTGDKGVIYAYNPQTRAYSMVLELGAWAATSPNFIGHSPATGLAKDGNGKLWGWTKPTLSSTSGWIFRVDPATRSVTRVLETRNSALLNTSLLGELVYDGVDSMWGVTAGGGAANAGTVFKIHQQTGDVRTVVIFTGESGAVRGRSPLGSLVRHADGHLYGMVMPGGGSAPGMTYKVNIATGDYASVMTVPNVEAMQACQESLVVGPDGKLYGFGVPSVDGSPAYGGQLFRVDPADGRLEMLWAFQDRAQKGWRPVMLGVVGGGVCGLTAEGGASGGGMYFTLSQTFRSISFSTDSEGFVPAGGLLSLPDGKLAGMTKGGGRYGMGTAYFLGPNTRPVPSVQSVARSSSDAREPVGELVSVPGGRVMAFSKYGPFPQERGMLLQGNWIPGAFGQGLAPYIPLGAEQKNPVSGPGALVDGQFYAASGTTLFQIDAQSMSNRRLATFTSENGPLPGSEPFGKPMADEDGLIWGVTGKGGILNAGTIYRHDPRSRTTTTVVDFGNTPRTEGREPRGTLVADGLGYLWGVTRFGGHADVGTLYRLQIDTGKVETIHHFSAGLHVLGSEPMAGLTSDGRGRLWGTTSKGGLLDKGVIFQVDPKQAKVYAFESLSGTAPGYASLSHPEAPLVLHVDGNLYGTTTGPGFLAGHGTGAVSGGGIFRVRFGAPLVVDVFGHPVDDGGTVSGLGAFVVGHSETINMRVRNASGAELIRNLTAEVSGPHKADFKLVKPFKVDLPNAEFRDLEVVFNPSAVGKREATITFGGRSPDTDEFVVHLEGDGIRHEVALEAVDAPVGPEGGRFTMQVSIGHPRPDNLVIPVKLVPGTATTDDYRLGSTAPVVIRAGQTTATFTVQTKEDYQVEDQESFHVEIGRPAGAFLELLSSSVELFIDDNDVEPTLDDQGHQLFRVGDTFGLWSGLNLNGGDMPVEGEWTKEGSNRVLGRETSLYIDKAKLSDAGTYYYEVRTASGSRMRSPPIHLIIMDDRVQYFVAKPGDGVVLSLPIAGPDLSFAWMGSTLDGLHDTLMDGGRISGATTSTLRIADIQPGDSGVYLVYVDGPEGIFWGDVTMYLNVCTKAPKPEVPQFPVWRVGEAVEYMLPRSPDSTEAPQSVRVQGLPPGLVCHSVSGIITGAPRKAGRFPVTVTMSNAFGIATVTGTVLVAELPAGLVGSFDALLGPIDLAPGGGLLQINVTAEGSATGVVRIAGSRYSFISRIQANAEGDYLCDVHLPGPPPFQTSKAIGLSLSLEPDRLSGDYWLSWISGGSGSSIEGWRNVWTSSSLPHPGLVGRYPFGIVFGDPVGSGYGHMQITGAGRVTVTGVLPDDSSFTTSCALSPEGWILGFQPFGHAMSAIQFQAQVTPPASDGRPAFIGQENTGWGMWCPPPRKPGAQAFGVTTPGSLRLGFNMLGGSLPPSGGLPMGLAPSPAGRPNAELFLDWAAQGTASDGLQESKPLRVTSSPSVSILNQGGPGNRIRVQRLLIHPEKGMFLGSLTLDGGTSKARTASFKGLLVPALQRAFGFCLYPRQGIVQPGEAGSEIDYSPLQSRPVVLQGTPVETGAEGVSSLQIDNGVLPPFTVFTITAP